MISRRGKLAAAAAAITVAVAFGHVPVARWAAGGSCPWGGRTATPAQMEAQRQITANRLRGGTQAATRPAFGFALDTNTRADVQREIDRAGGACKEELEGAALRCEIAAAAGRPSVRDAFFRFSPAGVLVAVDVMREPASPEAAASLLEQLTAKLSREAGPVTTSRGEATAEALASGHLAQAVREYRFTDYAADLTATNFGDGGKSPEVVVREQYRSLRLTATASR